MDRDENAQCGEGISLANLDWCMKEWRAGYRILIMEFFVKQPTRLTPIMRATSRESHHLCDAIAVLDQHKES